MKSAWWIILSKLTPTSGWGVNITGIPTNPKGFALLIEK